MKSSAESDETQLAIQLLWKLQVEHRGQRIPYCCPFPSKWYSVYTMGGGGMIINLGFGIHYAFLKKQLLFLLAAVLVPLFYFSAGLVGFCV